MLTPDESAEYPPQRLPELMQRLRRKILHARTTDISSSEKGYLLIQVKEIDEQVQRLIDNCGGSLGVNVEGSSTLFRRSNSRRRRNGW